MNCIKISVTVDERLYRAFQKLYPHTLRQAIESLLRKAIYNDDFLWNFINEPDVQVRIPKNKPFGPIIDPINLTDVRISENENNQ